MYGVKDIMNITGYKECKCRQLIQKTQEEIKKEKPEYIPLTARIPIRYFNKYVLLIDSDESQVKKSP